MHSQWSHSKSGEAKAFPYAYLTRTLSLAFPFTKNLPHSDLGSELVGFSVHSWLVEQELFQDKGLPLPVSNKVQGKVIEVGASGNLICDISAEQLAGAPSDDSVVVSFSGHQTFGIHPDNHGQVEATLVAKLNSSSQLEIEIVGMNLSEMLSIAVDSEISISW